MKNKEKDLQRLTNLTNEFLKRFIEVLDPKDYEMEHDQFINMASTAPEMLAANIIDKLSGTFGIERDEIKKLFIEKLNLALLWVDHSQKGK